MLPIPGRLPEGPQWRYEVSWDGMRVLAEVTGGTLRLTSRIGRDVTAHFPELTGLVDLVGDGLFDGEVILLDAGLPSSVALADRVRVTRSRRPARTTHQVSQHHPAVLMTFDVLRLYGVPLLHRSLDERRATLERVGLERVGIGAARCVALSPVYDDGHALLSATRTQRLEGVVAKRRDAPYRPGVRDPSWVKVAHEHG
jgi:bifunctional non-homologous end joining protein LigD